MDILNGLNDRQKEAVTHVDGPLLVVAGAGSGKTRVLTYRVAYLLAERGIPPYFILAVTFTNKAAKEMKDRIARLAGPLGEQVWVATFHSTCVQILRREADKVGYQRNFLIFDTADQLSVVKAAIKDLNLDSRKIEPRTALYAISGAKNELISPEEYDRKATDFWDKTIAQIYATYQRKLMAANALDFDDLIMATVKLFRTSPEVLGRYQDRFRYILVDEYQDTNHAQYVLVNLLAKKHRNLCVVGDADQSIYGFRGADIRNILEFEKDYPDAKVVKLEQNYRSTEKILESANAVIANNLGRKEKELWTDHEGGDPLFMYKASDEREEASFVAEEIQKLKKDGHDYHESAILYRTHSQSRTFEEEFMRRGIPYTIVAGLRFYERKEIKDLIAYLRLLENPSDIYSLRRVINVPKRGIGDATLGRLESFALESNITAYEALQYVEQIPGLGGRGINALQRFYELMENLRSRVGKVSLTRLTEDVLSATGYVTELEAERTPEADGRIENLKEFLSVTKQYEEETPAAELAGFLEHVALVADVDSYDETADAVVMMSLHAAKGLEFPVVFLVGMEEGVFPHSRSLWEPGELEEERRLCYVGITRAMRRLYLTYAELRTLYGSTSQNFISRFIEEIPEDCINELHSSRVIDMGGNGKGKVLRFPSERIQEPAGKKHGAVDAGDSQNAELKVGARVKHTHFGEGTVVAVTGEGRETILTVAFPNQGIKRFLAEYTPLVKL
ncbi:MAG: DNA helicase PcrA [Firmicutes bacterium]|nr:DNA helicase PcrA [Bacillota bacterium]